MRRGATKTSVVALLKRYCGLTEGAPNGAYCRLSTGIGTASTTALPAGVIRVLGNGCLSIVRTIQTWKTAGGTAPLSVLRPVRRAPQQNGGQAQQALGRSRAGFSPKIHITVEGLGTPLRLHLTAGQRHDILKAHDLIVEALIADRSYGAQAVVDELIAHGIEPVIPPNQNAKQPREYDEWRYRERHLIECFIGKIKHFRRVFSRFDKLARRYLGFLHLTCVLVWLR